MGDAASVTTWIRLLRDGDYKAATPLWKRYYAKLVRLARSHLTQRVRRAADEEDVVSAAFLSFVRGVEAGRFPRLDDRNDLWRVLFCLTLRKASAHARHETAHRRGDGAVLPVC